MEDPDPGRGRAPSPIVEQAKNETPELEQTAISTNAGDVHFMSGALPAEPRSRSRTTTSSSSIRPEQIPLPSSQDSLETSPSARTDSVSSPPQVPSVASNISIAHHKPNPSERLWTWPDKIKRPKPPPRAKRQLKRKIAKDSKQRGPRDHLDRPTYLSTVRSLLAALPGLSPVVSPGRTAFVGRVGCFDYVSDGEGYRPEQVFDRQFQDWRPSVDEFAADVEAEIDPAVRLRVLLVEDISAELIEFLGSAFQMHPYFFREHLRDSAYHAPSSARLNRLDSTENPQVATWTSLQWHKTVSPLNERFNWNTDALLQGDWVKSFCHAPKSCPAPNSTHRSQLISNIIRPSADLPAYLEGTGEGTEPLASWHEKMTCWTGFVGRCKIVILLLDPTPSARFEAVEIAKGSPPSRNVQQSNALALGCFVEPRKEGEVKSWLDHLKNVTHGKHQMVMRRRRPIAVQDEPATPAGPTLTKRGVDDAPLYHPPAHDFRQPSVSALLPENDQAIAQYHSSHGSHSTYDQMVTLMMAEHSKTVIDPINMLLKVFVQDLTTYIDTIQISLENIRRSSISSSVVQERVSSWRSLLTKYRSDLARIEHDVIRFTRSVYPECVSWGDGDDLANGPVPKESSSLETDALQKVRQTLDTIDRSYNEIRSEISIVDSQKSIAEAESISKLTELAFIFVPLTFASSLFSMSIDQLQDPAPIYAFILTAIGFVALAYAARLMIRSERISTSLRSITRQAREDMNLQEGQGISTSGFVYWAVPQAGAHVTTSLSALLHKAEDALPAVILLLVIAALVSPIILLWRSKIDRGFLAVITLVFLVPDIALIWFITRHRLDKARNRLPWKKAVDGDESSFDEFYKEAAWVKTPYAK